MGVFSYNLLSCDNLSSTSLIANLTLNCNAGCNCNGVRYSPVCSIKTGRTFFSPCHAACTKWNNESGSYSGCACDAKEEGFYGSDNNPTVNKFDQLIKRHGGVEDFLENIMTPGESLRGYPHAHVWIFDFNLNIFILGPCVMGCENAFYIFLFALFMMHFMLGSGRIGNSLVLLRFVCLKIPIEQFSLNLPIFQVCCGQRKINFSRSSTDASLTVCIYAGSNPFRVYH